MKSIYHRLLGIFILSLILFNSSAFATTPMVITFQATLANDRDGLLNGIKTVEVRLTEGKSTSETDWKETHTVRFIDGTCSIVLGSITPLQASYFEKTAPYFRVFVDNQAAYFAIPSTPYAIQANTADVALSVDAKNVKGTFTNPLIVSADLKVNTNTLVVKNSSKRVGIGLNTPNYTLDVAGPVNASEYLLNGTPLTTALSWQKSTTNNILFHMGKVGIGKSDPQYALDVVGTINATGFTINNKTLEQYISEKSIWSTSGINTANIYFNENNTGDAGRVGIGTSTPREKLEINGALIVGKSRQTGTIADGTLQFFNNEFQGYYNSQWNSLSGVTGTGQTGQLAFWENNKKLTGSNALVWDNTNHFLGIGTSTPTARLDIVSPDNATLINIRTNTSNVILYATQDKVGIGTTAPREKLHVNGAVEASAFYSNGKLAQLFPDVWSVENDTTYGTRIFYDRGNVGIGTTAPVNLLELASRSTTRNVAIGFNIVTRNLFTLGVDPTQQDAFILSHGNNLSNPAFTFKEDRLGVGVAAPSVNFHVKGDLGVVFEGTFGSAAALAKSGPGTRLIWYPAKGAFRAGYASIDQFDQANLGNYSVGLGDSPLATGIASVVAGGKNNTASGNYSVVPGGLNNKAIGNYSFAAGRDAIAQHTGAFVWADNDPTSLPFTSAKNNQFIIRALNGVGIGTSDSTGSVLTIRHEPAREYILKGKGTGQTDVFVITTSGSVGIGTSDPKNAQLAVMGGPVGINTNTPQALLHVTSTTPNQTLFAVYKNNETSTASFFVNASGNVGIGVPTNYNFGESAIFVNGDIVAKSFRIQTPSGDFVIQPSTGSPWADPSKYNNNTFRNQGFIGIGTPSPNSLLELGDRNISGAKPVITFSINNAARYSQGLVTANGSANTYMLAFQSGQTISDSPPIVLSDDKIGIGMGRNIPAANLHVSGNTILSGNVAVGTSNTSSIFRFYVNGGLNTDRLFINGLEFIPGDDAWSTYPGTNHIYYTSGNVGIGTSSPLNDRLVVMGTVSANSLAISNPIELSGDITTSKLRLRDISNTTKFGELFVEQGDLRFTDITGNTKIISSPLKQADGNQGNLTFWVDSTTLGQSDIRWNRNNATLSVSGNLSAHRTYSASATGMKVSSNISIASTQNAIQTVSKLFHDGKNSDIKTFAGQDINVHVLDEWGSTNAIDVIGMNIKMQSDANLLNNAAAIGLKVDVSSTNIDASAQKYAAVFLGGKVGIGTTRPSAELEVNGTVSANFFNLSGNLDVNQLRVGGGRPDYDTMVVRSRIVGGVTKPRVGIGISDPELRDYELEVNGTISANELLVSNGIKSITANIGPSLTPALYVDASGNVGIGTTAPNGQIEIKKSITSLPEAEFKSQVIDITLDAASPGFTFNLDKNITGLEVGLKSSKPADQLRDATATGAKIDLSSLVMNNAATAIGLNVNVSGTNGIRHAALFTGGRVGIGTSEPQADLHVSGNIIANNLTLLGTLSANTATFNYLTVNKHATFNGTTSVNNLVVNQTLTANRVIILSGIVAPFGNFSTLNATVASVNNLLKAKDLVVTSFNGVNAHFTGGVGIGTTPPVSGLKVSGTTIADALNVTNLLTLTQATLNVNDSALFIGANARRIGIGTSTPVAPVHIMKNANLNFSDKDNTTWSTLRIQATTTLPGVGTGILMVPDSQTPSESIGSGLIAVRTNTNPDTPGSSLIFVTDPNSGLPAERMRLTGTGLLGIGTSSPISTLHVNGTSRFDGTVTVNGTVFASTITAPADLTISPNGTLRVDGTASFNKNIQVGGTFYLKKTNQSSPVTDYGLLFVNQTDNNLYYQAPGSSNAVNISLPLTGLPNKIPYFNNSGSLTDSAPLYWLQSANSLQVGTANQLANVNLNTVVDNAVSGNVAAHRINLEFEDRSGLSDPTPSTFTGLDIQFKAKQGGLDFGRLAQNERAIGLKVDVSALNPSQFGVNTGKIYSALFLGGSVGIGTSEPQASLHVTSTSTGNAPLRVDTASNPYALLINANSQVGLGTSNPDARLTIKGSTNPTEALMKVTSSTNAPYMNILNSGLIGIGTAVPSATLHVMGTISANNILAGGLQGTTLNIGNGNLYMDASGNVGLGTTNPSGNLSISKTFTPQNPPSSAFTSHKINLTLDKTPQLSNVFYNQDFTGMAINFSSATGAQLGTGVSTVNATGVSINMSQLKVAQNSQAIGLRVDVTGTTGKRIAALFNGGNVGIGTTAPSQALEVSGNIKATSLQLTGSILANTATFNNLIVSNAATFNGTVSMNALEVQTLSANRIILTKSLTVATANFTTLNVTNVGVFNKVGIGVSVPAAQLDVAGSVLINKNLTVNGTIVAQNLISSTNLTISASQNLVINATTSVNANVQLGGALYLATQNNQPATDLHRGILYLDKDKNLNYLRPGLASETTPVRISQALSGIAGRIPYFDADQNLSPSTNISWNNTSKTLTFGTSSDLTSVVVVSSLNTSVSGNLTGESVILGFEDRALASPINSGQFTGLNIKFDAQENGTGGLAQGETAVGLKVDVQNVVARYSTTGPLPSDSTFSGYKYAALFLGGSVGIGTSTPESSLHIQSHTVNSNALRVDVQNTANALLVNKNGFVGIGTSTPIASLSVKGQSANTSGVLSITSASNAPILFANNNQMVGIGTDIPSASLHIVGANPLHIGTSTQANALVLNEKGMMGLNTGNPSGNFHVVGNTTDPAFKIDVSSTIKNSLVVANTGRVGIGTSTPYFRLSIDGIAMAGTSNFTTQFVDNIPSWLTNTSETTRGFLSSSGPDNVFVGVRQRSGNAYDGVLVFGKETTDTFRFEHYNGSITRNVMVLDGNGRVGIGTNFLSPLASLHVSGNVPLIVGNSTVPNALVVTGNGYVGIGTTFPSANLHINGTLMTNVLKITSSDITVTTLNVTGHLSVLRTSSQNTDITGQKINIIVSANTAQNITGLDINLNSAFNNDPSNQPNTEKFYIHNGGTGTGLKVDVSGVREHNTPSGAGYKYAAVFLGGNVGIGTTQPQTPLHVARFLSTVDSSADIARFGSNGGDMTIRDYNTGKMTFYIRDNVNNSSSSYITLGMAPSTASGAGIAGRVGIGTSSPSEALEVNGDIRLGSIKSSDTAQAAGFGNQLYFSGGPDVIGISGNGENGSSMFMARYNQAAYQSELRTVIGTSNSVNNKFRVGYTNQSLTDYKPILDVRMNGFVGISDGQSSFTPSTFLHIKGSPSGTTDYLQSHLAVIQNTQSSNPNALAIYLSGVSGIGAPTTAKFISFYTASGTLMGAIQGNGASNAGVQYMSIGADYAEYLEKEDHKESIEKGDIVGVTNGKISKYTAQAQQVMVKSSAPSVAGNYPGEDKLDQYSLVAFFGQVPVKVRGKVNLGDYIIPSDKNDGTGIAISSKNIQTIPPRLIVGRAWESSNQSQTKLIKVALGFKFSQPSLENKYQEIQALKEEIKNLRDTQSRNLKEFSDKIDSQSKEIDTLLGSLKKGHATR